MKRFYKPTSKNSIDVAAQKDQTQIYNEFNVAELMSDPGLRKALDEYDIGIRDQVRREYLLRGLYQPIGHHFPRKKQGKDSRKFQEHWFQQFDWLEYSIEKDAAYCFYCYLFNEKKSDKFGCEVFTKVGFNNWKKALGVFNAHVGSINSNHNNARLHCGSFKNERQSVSHVLSFQTKEMEHDYRTRLTASLDVVQFLLLQGLAFRGHKESVTFMNRGNFLAMLDWYADKDKNIGRVVNTNAPGNNHMTSPQIQKELVRACVEETINVIISEIGDSQFSILIDESRDISIKEQMTLVIRFVNKKGQVIERFLGIEHVSDTSAASLKTVVNILFARYGLCISNLRGQGYDGASNMRGQFNGLKTLILKENPFAFYVHCFAHRLQLVVVLVSRSNPYVLDFFNYTIMIVNTVGSSCKRNDILLQKHYENILDKVEKFEISTGKGKNQESNLAKPGDTRWGSHHTTLVRLFTMWESVIEVLQVVYDDGTTVEQRGTSWGLIEKMESFEYVFILHLMMKILGLTNDLSRTLQQKDQNIINAMLMIGIVKDVIQELRDKGWDAFLEEVKTFCIKMFIPIPEMEDSMPIRGRSRREGQWITYYHHYHAEIFLAVIDSLIVELNNRFNETSIELLRCIACLDPKNSFCKFDHGKLLKLSEIYCADFSSYERIVLKDQLCIYIADVRVSGEFANCHDLASLAMKMVETERHLAYPLVYRLIELALILPVTTATVERAFSAMNIIKTDLRNKISDEWLNDIMVCYLEKDIFLSVEKEQILQRFQSMQNRRIQLPLRND